MSYEGGQGRVLWFPCWRLSWSYLRAIGHVPNGRVWRPCPTLPRGRAAGPRQQPLFDSHLLGNGLQGRENKLNNLLNLTFKTEPTVPSILIFSRVWGSANTPSPAQPKAPMLRVPRAPERSLLGRRYWLARPGARRLPFSRLQGAHSARAGAGT